MQWSLIAWEAYVTLRFLMLTAVLSLILAYSAVETPAGKSDLLSLALRVVVPLAWLFLGYLLIQFVDQVYPTLPQEFGGFHPRRAILHLRVQALSKPLRLTFLATEREALGVAESKEVLVFYADKERVIVKIPPKPLQGKSEDMQAVPAYELSTETIVAATYLR